MKRIFDIAKHPTVKLIFQNDVDGWWCFSFYQNMSQVTIPTSAWTSATVQIKFKALVGFTLSAFRKKSKTFHLTIKTASKSKQSRERWWLIFLIDLNLSRAENKHESHAKKEMRAAFEAKAWNEIILWIDECFCERISRWSSNSLSKFSFVWSPKRETSFVLLIYDLFWNS